MGHNQDGKLCFSPTHTKWLEDYQSEVDRYLYENVEEYSREYVRQTFEEFPSLGRTVVEDFVINSEDENNNVNELIEYIRDPGVFVILILGMPNSGKTTTAWSIANHMRKFGYNIVYISPLKPDGLPDWVTWKNNPSQLEAGDFAIVDEASIQNNARASSSRQNNDDLMWLAVGRHRGAKMVYLSQLSSIADLNLTRWANVIVSKGYGTSAVGASEIERKHIADNPILNYMKPTANYAGVKSAAKDWAVVTAHGTTYMVYLPKPAFMNDTLSRTYKDYRERAHGDQALANKLAMHDAKLLKDSGHDAGTIHRQMLTRGFLKSRTFWKEFTGEIQKKGDRDDFD